MLLSSSSSLEIRLRTNVAAVLRAELANSEFQFGLEASEGRAQRRTVRFLRNLREPKFPNNRFLVLLENGNAALQGQREGESEEKCEMEEACCRIIDKEHGRSKTSVNRNLKLLNQCNLESLGSWSPIFCK